MPDPMPPDERLAYLQERWEQDPTSRVFVQLAEEYRRRGEGERALEVLQKGLAEHPKYLSAQVALGRCLLDLGRPEAGSEVLGKVLAQDPTHLVACRLLVDAHLALGDLGEALSFLERYRLLGPPSEELEGLEERVATLRTGTLRAMRGETGSQPAMADSGGPKAVPAGEPEGASEVAEQEVASEPVEEPSVATAGGGGSEAAVVFALRADEVPKLRLSAVTMARSRRLRGAVGRDPLPILPRLRPVGETVSEGRVLSMGGASAPSSLRPVAGEAAMSSVEVIPEPASARRLESEQEAVIGPAPVTEAATHREETVAAKKEEEAAGPPGAEVDAGLATYEPLPEAPDVAEADEELVEAPATAAESLAGQDVAGETATATLGELYLRQGYRAEAEKIFRQVLRREPENRVAQEGVARLEREHDRWLRAEDLVGEEAPVSGVTARKISLLEKYLSVIRQGAGRDVPRKTE